MKAMAFCAFMDFKWVVWSEGVVEFEEEWVYLAAEDAYSGSF